MQALIVTIWVLNIFLNEIFFIGKETNFTSYSDDNTPERQSKILTLLLSHQKKIPISCFSVFEIIK